MALIEALIINVTHRSIILSLTIILIAVMPNVIMLNVIMQNVVAPIGTHCRRIKKGRATLVVFSHHFLSMSRS
jgi:hypothetical protein